MTVEQANTTRPAIWQRIFAELAFSLLFIVYFVVNYLSVGIFGHVPALVTITGLAVFTSYIWYRTGKRDVYRMELARSRSLNRTTSGGR